LQKQSKGTVDQLLHGIEIPDGKTPEEIQKEIEDFQIDL
jgi:hypothetical protein